MRYSYPCALIFAAGLLWLAMNAIAFAQAPAAAQFDEHTPILQRRVSLNAEGVTLHSVLEDLCRQAGAEFRCDFQALAYTNLNPAKLVPVAIDDDTLQDAFARLIDSGPRSGVGYRAEGKVVRLATWKALHQWDRKHVPQWIAAVRGVSARVDLAGDVYEVYAGGAAITDQLAARIATLPRLRKLDLSRCENLTKKGLSRLVKTAHLEELDISGADDLGDAVLHELRGHPSLRSIRISECGTTDEGIRGLHELPNLRELSLYQEGRLTDAALEMIAELTHLRSLSLTSYVSTQEYGWMRFSPDAMNKLSALRELEVLNLSGNPFPADALPLPHLRVLAMSGENIDDRIGERLAQCANLQALKFESTQIGDETLRAIAGLKRLNHLTIDGGRVTDDGLRHLADMRRLEYLQLRRLPISNAGMAHVAEIKSLTRIDLIGGGKGPLNAAGLSLLKDLPHLRTLWLMGYDDPAGFAGLKALTQLRELHFDMCSLNEEQFHSLEAALPDTGIMAGHGGGWLRSSRNAIDQPGILTN